MCFIYAVFLALVLGAGYLYVQTHGYERTGILVGLLALAYAAKRTIKRRDLANLLTVGLCGAAVYLVFLWFR